MHYGVQSMCTRMYNYVFVLSADRLWELREDVWIEIRYSTRAIFHVWHVCITLPPLRTETGCLRREKLRIYVSQLRINYSRSWKANRVQSSREHSVIIAAENGLDQRPLEAFSTEITRRKTMHEPIVQRFPVLRSNDFFFWS